ncbi:MAG: rRNA pseudouridine synthase [Alphaproteobacteria bacterium]|nr:rRNA pseudouridine synthase [Alphaproteobacteria bacterium]
MKTRIAKFIADSGIASRREAEKLIVDGKVFVNGEKILTPVFFINGDEKILVDGKSLAGESQARIFAFNKPINTMTTRSDPQARATIYDYLPAKLHNFKYVGRLDYKTTGLLLLTNDGELARRLTLPSSGIKRVYVAGLHPKSFAEIKSPARAKALRGFLSPLNSDDFIFDNARNGIKIDGVQYAPMEIELLSRYPLTVRLTLQEGKKNEIRIVMDYLGFLVKKLHRESYGPTRLGDLAPGKVRELNAKEIKLIE